VNFTDPLGLQADEEEIVVTAYRLQTGPGLTLAAKLRPPTAIRLDQPLANEPVRLAMAAPKAKAPRKAPARRSESDYCSKSPDRFGKIDISGACYKHDACYASSKSREECDADLGRDVWTECRRQGGDAAVCFVMSAAYYKAVRWFGLSHYVGTGSKD
jgi:hypothetical protein